MKDATRKGGAGQYAAVGGFGKQSTRRRQAPPANAGAMTSEQIKVMIRNANNGIDGFPPTVRGAGCGCGVAGC